MPKVGKGITTMSIITLLTGCNMTMGKPDKPKVSKIKQRKRTENFLEPHPPPVLLEEEDWRWQAKGFNMVVVCHLSPMS